MAHQVQALKVGEDRQRRAKPAQLAGLGERRGRRLGAHHSGEHVRRGQPTHHLLAVNGERRAQLRIQLPASTSGDLAAGGCLAAGEVGEHGLLGHVDHPRGQMYLLSRTAIGNAAAIPALIDMVQSGDRGGSIPSRAPSAALTSHPDRAA